MAENFPKLTTGIMLEIQEAQKIPSIINTKKYAPQYIVSKPEKTKENKKILKEATGRQHLTCRKMRIKRKDTLLLLDMKEESSLLIQWILKG